MFDSLTRSEARQLSECLVRATQRFNGSATALIRTGHLVEAAAHMAALSEATNLVLDLTHERAQTALAAEPCGCWSATRLGSCIHGKLDGCTCDGIAGSHRPSCAWAMR